MSDHIELLNKRDAKTIPHLTQYAPVWLTEQVVITEDEAIQFHAVFHHHHYGWVSRRYRYDGFNNVLYHKGQTPLSEDDAVNIQDTEPYISTVVTNSPNAYGG